MTFEEKEAHDVALGIASDIAASLRQIVELLTPISQWHSNSLREDFNEHEEFSSEAVYSSGGIPFVTS